MLQNQPQMQEEDGYVLETTEYKLSDEQAIKLLLEYAKESPEEFSECILQACTTCPEMLHKVLQENPELCSKVVIESLHNPEVLNVLGITKEDILSQQTKQEGDSKAFLTGFVIAAGLSLVGVCIYNYVKK